MTCADQQCRDLGCQKQHAISHAQAADLLRYAADGMHHATDKLQTQCAVALTVAGFATCRTVAGVDIAWEFTADKSKIKVIHNSTTALRPDAPLASRTDRFVGASTHNPTHRRVHARAHTPIHVHPTRQRARAHMHPRRHALSRTQARTQARMHAHAGDGHRRWRRMDRCRTRRPAGVRLGWLHGRRQARAALKWGLPQRTHNSVPHWVA